MRWNFEAGLADPSTFPAADPARIAAAVLAGEPEVALQYATTADGSLAAGDAGLRDRALEAGVACRPGERFSGQPDRGRQFLRLVFGSVPVEEVEQGVGVLGDAIAASVRPARSLTS